MEQRFSDGATFKGVNIISSKVDMNICGEKIFCTNLNKWNFMAGEKKKLANKSSHVWFVERKCNRNRNSNKNGIQWKQYLLLLCLFK